MRRSMPFSNLPIMLKFLFMDLMLIAAVMLIWLAMLRSVKNTQGEKYREMEYNAVSASSNILNLSVEDICTIGLGDNTGIEEGIHRQIEILVEEVELHELDAQFGVHPGHAFRQDTVLAEAADGVG